MKKYFPFVSCAIQNALVYRKQLVISLFSDFIYIVVMFFLWKSIFKANGIISSYSWETMKIYIFLSYFLNASLSFYSESKISMRILDGSISMDLLKPVNYKLMCLSEGIGISVIEYSIGIIIIALSAFMFHINFCITIFRAILFLLSFALSFFIKFNLVFMFSTLCFWTTNSYGVMILRDTITKIFSGALIPLAMFPQMFKEIALFLPFQGIVYTPTSIYLGKVDIKVAIILIITQLFWVIALWLLGSMLFNRAIKKVTIYGG